MDVFGTARNVYKAIKDDAEAVASVRAEYAALALEVATSSKGGLDITSATVNGQSFAGTVSITKSDRLQLLNLVLAQVDAGGCISRRSRVHF